MPKIMLLFMFFLCVAGCDTRDRLMSSTWIVESSNSGEKRLKKGTVVEFKTDSIQFTIEGDNRSYPCMISENRLLVYTGITKWLFSYETSGKRLIINELYQKESTVIILGSYHK
jgi:hypothetical protein